MGDIGNSQMDAHNRRARLFGRTRTMGPEGAGSLGDTSDRFRDVYSPGANPVPPQPLDSLIIKGARAAKSVARAVSKALGQKPATP